MKITITTPAKFPAAFAAARYHERQGELERIISPVPRSRSRRFGVSDARNSGLAPLGAWNYGFQRFGPRSLQQRHQLAFSAAFDEAASRMLGDCDVVNAWCSTALRTIRAAHSRGTPVVLEVASAHILAQVRLLREEFSRFGEDIDRAVITPGVIERTLHEYDEADAIIVTSSFVKRTFVERGVDATKITVIPYGVDALTPAPVGRAFQPATSPNARPASDAPASVARAFQPDTSPDAHPASVTPAPVARAFQPATSPNVRPSSEHRPPRVLFVGGCSLRKGVPYLVEAFRRIGTPADLRLVGRTNDGLFHRIGGLPRGVEAVGPKIGGALDTEYRAADVFVLPSVEDGWGLVTNEAMSAGLPVIVSDHAGSAEIVRDGVNGFVVPARDVDALAECMALLLGDDELRARMGAAARETAASRTWETYGDERRARVYEPLLSGRRRVADALAA